jgi:RNA polymerase sigma factor (sigma-70 family)
LVATPDPICRLRPLFASFRVPPESLDTSAIRAFKAQCQEGAVSKNETAASAVLACFRRQTDGLFRKFGVALQRWEDADDVYQSAVLRLLQRVDKFEPENRRHFQHFAAQLVRSEIVDLARRYFGPHGKAAKLRSGAGGPEPGSDSIDPALLAEWTELHQYFDALSEPDRSVADLVYYHDASCAAAAAELGVDESTVRKRWRRIRHELAKRFPEWKRTDL